MKKIIATTNAPAAIGPYSQAIDCGSFLVTSGQVPFDPKTGEFVPGGIHSGIIHTFYTLYIFCILYIFAYYIHFIYSIRYNQELHQSL